MNRILISSLHEGDNRYQDRFTAEDLDLKVEGAALGGEVEVQGIIRKSPPLLELSGKLAFRVGFECARCLKGYFQDYRISFRSCYQQVDVLRPGWEVEPDIRNILSSTKELDVLPEVREAILFALPAVPLCRADCPGLCPHCGADLSLGTCGCSVAEEEFDPRWEALRKLKP
jgi:uncharacterized protein